MNNKFATGGFNFSSIIMKNIDRNKLTYAQQIILKKASKKKNILNCNVIVMGLIITIVMETTMMQNIADCCQCNIGDYDKIYDNAISIVVGIIASLVAWVIVNRALIPNVIVSELLYSNKNKPYVIVWNKSKLKIDLYEVVCYIYYYEKSKKYASFIRTDNKKALLSCGEKMGIF